MKEYYRYGGRVGLCRVQSYVIYRYIISIASVKKVVCKGVYNDVH